MSSTLKTTDWTTKEFITLLRSLSEIPAHLYVLSAQKKSQGNINFSVVDLPDTLARRDGHTPFKECYCKRDVENPHIILLKNISRKGKKISVNTRTIVHDLIHRATDGSLDELSKEFFNILSAKDFRDIQRRFMSELTSEIYAHSFIVTGYKGSLGFGATNIREFFSVAAEYYIQGEEEFFKAYKKFFSDKELGALHKFFKEKIFKEEDI